MRYFNSFVLACCFVGTGLLAGGLAAVRDRLPDAEELIAYRPRLATEIYSTEIDAEGNTSHTLLGRVFKEDREPVDLQRIPLDLRNATIAIEDRPFYQHRGIDPKGIIRAAWVNFRRGGLHQGGSTITQQLVRNMWLSREKTVGRKINEIILALELERRYSKDEMLEMYLNEVYYGHGAYGVKVAAKMYFDKDVQDLSLAEAALLAGLPRSPIYYSPYNHPQRAKQRRQQVLHAMVEMGQITSTEANEADTHQIQANLAPLREMGITAFRAPYFTHLIVRRLCEEYGVEPVYEGGLRVYTSLDMRLQEAAEQALTEQIESLRRRGQIKRGLVGQGALAAVEVSTGDVLAMVGGVGPYEKVQYNRAYPGPPQFGRQPGSSFKPYVWAAALENGYGSESVFSGSPISIKTGTRYWNPKNYSPRQGGNYTLRRALADSVNLVSVRIVQRLGPQVVRTITSQITGITEDRFPLVPAISLGVSELAPLEQAVGYCTFASGGWGVKPRFIRRITTVHGDELISYKPDRKRALNQSTAISMNSMMRTVVTSGTGTRASVPGYEICGKTGTTQDGRDAWWVGYSPDLTCAVWVGNDDYTPMRGSTGGGFCAPVFAKFMGQALKLRNYHGKYPEGAGAVASRRSQPEKDKEKPGERPRSGGGGTVTICTSSGGRATPYCPSTAEKTLGPGESSPPPCRIHSGGSRAKPSEGSSSQPAASTTSGGGRTVTVCSQSGQLAGPYCPQTVEKRFASGTGPSGTCKMHGPSGGASSGSSSPAKPVPSTSNSQADPRPPAADTADTGGDND